MLIPTEQQRHDVQFAVVAIVSGLLVALLGVRLGLGAIILMLVGHLTGRYITDGRRDR